MTEQERATLKALAEAAMPGDWVVRHANGRAAVWLKLPGGGYCKIASVEAPDHPPFVQCGRSANAAFIAAARTAVPALLAENEQLRALVVELTDGRPARDDLPAGDAEPATHYNRRGEWECNYCKAHSHDDIRTFTHAEDCPVTRGRALGGAQ